ncbi:MAG TPA: exosortase system-associated protein, TIGR04073 family [Verrucomicrobiae bacterium]
MFKKISVLLPVAVVSCLVAGCAGPEEKLGRGMNNTVEFARLGELRRSFEQASIFGAPDNAYTTGIFHGIGRSLERTGVGLYEVVTFPIPNHKPGDYGAVFHPADPLYPDSYKPNWLSDAITSPDTSLGFAGGDIAPIIPGSRFHVFDN